MRVKTVTIRHAEGPAWRFRCLVRDMAEYVVTARLWHEARRVAAREMQCSEQDIETVGSDEKSR